MAAKKTVCPQCRTDSGIVLLDKNAERAMYKCKKCRPFHIFSISNCVDDDETSLFELEVENGAGSTEKPSRRKMIGLVMALVLVCAAIGVIWYFCRG